MKLIVIQILLPLMGCVALPAITQNVNQSSSSHSSFFESKSFSVNSSDFGSMNFHHNSSMQESKGVMTFQTFIQHFNKSLENLTEQTKTFYQRNFEENMKFILESQKLNLSFTLGVNAFTHLSSEEFVDKYCGTIAPESYQVQDSFPILNAKNIKNKLNNYTMKNLPKEMDWRKSVQPVINQKTCGSCWAFATMAMIESHNMLKSKKWNYQLSPQYLVDCDPTNHRCEGGWPENAAKWLKEKSKNQAPTLKDYPYINKNGTCKTNVNKVQLNINNIQTFKLNSDEEEMQLALANFGPLAIAMHVSKKNKLFQLYESGVFYDEDCPKSVGRDNQCEKVNHAMLLVGYGTTKKGIPYWLVKNSWGSSWGEDGYVRMIRNKKNNCNVACYATIVD